jgi:hypothetical protein
MDVKELIKIFLVDLGTSDLSFPIIPTELFTKFGSLNTPKIPTKYYNIKRHLF